MPLPEVKVGVRDPGLGLVNQPGSNAQMVIGATSLGTVNTFYSYQQIPDLVSNLGSGPGVEMAALALTPEGHGEIYVTKPNTSVAGSNSAVTNVGGGPTVTVAGTPNDGYEFKARLLLGGVLGTSTFQYTLDGGDNWSEAIATAASFPIPGTGLTLTMAAGTYVVDATYSFTSTPSFMNSTDVANAMDAAVNGTPDFAIMNIVGSPATAADAATLVAAVQTKLESIASSKKRWLRCIMHMPDDTDSNLIAAFASVVAPRVAPAAGYAEVVSAISFRLYKRSSGFPIAARATAVPLSEHLGRVASGPLTPVKKIYRDELATPALDAARFMTLRTWPRRAGFYITRPKLLNAAGSDLAGGLHLGRILDAACGLVYDKLLDYENDDVRLYPIGHAKAGLIYEGDARAIDAELENVLRVALINTSPKAHVSDVKARVVRTDNIISSKELRAEVSIVPKGYLEFLSAFVGLTNPAIQLLDAA